MKTVRYKIILVATTFLMSVFSAACFAQDDVVASTAGPKLLWKKEFKTKINSLAMSDDGTRIVVATFDGKLYYFDNWKEYKFIKIKFKTDNARWELKKLLFEKNNPVITPSDIVIQETIELAKRG